MRKKPPICKCTARALSSDLKDISVDKGETLNMTVSQDGRELSFTASADGETPSIYITTDDGADKPSYEFEIGGITLAARQNRLRQTRPGCRIDLFQRR